MDKLKTGFVICSRVNSGRVPRKCFALINGKPLIEHLIARCSKVGYPVFLAVPGTDYAEYRYLKNIFPALTIHIGQASDPLARTANVAAKYELDRVIRVCHDKIFVEKEAVDAMLLQYDNEEAEYAFSSTGVAGASIEILCGKMVQLAAKKFSDVEHVSYAMRAITKRVTDVDLSVFWKSEHRFLVDYPEDIRVLDLVLRSKGNDCTLADAIAFMNQHTWVSRLNQHPKITIYTCAYNAEKWLTRAMGSVAKQQNFNRMEYILIDDCSSDATSLLMSKFCSVYKNARWIKNEKNKGLASSSNIALTGARGKYIIRLDADDYFVPDNALDKLVYEIDSQNKDVIYPDNYFGGFKIVQSGDELHHIGGALFRTRAANHIKFTEGLRGYEGLDFFKRAQSSLSVGYLKTPVFFYRQHGASLSKNNLEERRKLLQSITSAQVP